MVSVETFFPASPAPAQPNQSLIDGITCLEALAGMGEPVGSRALAREVGLEPTRVNRLLKTLAYIGLVEQDSRRRYTPGPGIHALAARSLFGSGLAQRALGPLSTLEDLGLSVALGVLWRGSVSYLYHAEPGMDRLEGVGRVGLFPAAESGLGHVLLAQQAAQGAPDAALCGVSREVLGTWIELGYALTPGFGEGVRSIAVAIRSAQAAIGLSGVFTDDSIDGILGRLREVADQIDRRDQPA